MHNMLQRLYQLNRQSKFKYNLTSILSLCALLGDPHSSFPCIHVAGTNGKGSVTHKLQQILSSNNLKTGKFVSPHVTTFRERITIDNQLIPTD